MCYDDFVVVFVVEYLCEVGCECDECFVGVGLVE